MTSDSALLTTVRVYKSYLFTYLLTSLSGMPLSKHAHTHKWATTRKHNASGSIYLMGGGIKITHKATK